jgi:hypothetical protein
VALDDVVKRRDWDEIREIYSGRPMAPNLIHGGDSWARRAYGCRCEVCMGPRRRPTGKGRAPRLHGPGTWSRRVLKCACEICTTNPDRKKPMTHQERQKKLRQAKRGQPVPPTVKHGIYVYKTYACRCEVCLAAERLRVHKNKNPWMYRPTRGRWKEENGLTTLCWPPAGAGPDWRCVCDAQREVLQV